MTEIKRFSDFKIPPPDIIRFIGDKISVKKILDKEITIFHYKIVPSNYTDKGNGKRLDMQIQFNGEKRLIRTSAIGLQQIIQDARIVFPFTTIIKEEEESEMFRFT